MKFIGLSLSILLIVLGAYFSRLYQKRALETPAPKVLSQEKEEETSPTPLAVSLTPTPKDPSPTIKVSQNNLLSSYRYPNSVSINETSTTLSLESTDNTDIITDWFKAKIEESGANVKSFVKTKSNEKVLNKLVGSDGNFEIRVEISKETDTSKVIISVTLKNLTS